MVVVDIIDLVLLLIVSSRLRIQVTLANLDPDGFGGANKIFLMEFAMPKDGAAGVCTSRTFFVRNNKPIWYSTSSMLICLQSGC